MESGKTDGVKPETGIGAKQPDNKTDSSPKRNAKGQYCKGSSGNVGGRPKIPMTAKERLVSMLPKALDTVQSIIDDEKVKPDIRMRAAELVIERNLGKAVTPVLTETVGTGSTLTLAEMIACAKELLDSD